MCFCRRLVLGLFLGVILIGLAFAEPVDLGKRYPATLDFSEQPRGLECTCGPEDIWA